jgi:CRP-like cAMP-binding protein
MADLRALKDKAAELASRGKLEKAADHYREVLAAEPSDVASRQRLADVLRRAGRQAEAVAAYGQVAERFARDGQLIKAIAVCKTLLEVDPRHQATQRVLAELYGRRSAESGLPPPAARLAGQAPAPPAGAGPVLPPGSGLPPELEIEVEPERGVAIPLGRGPAAERGAPAGGADAGYHAEPAELFTEPPPSAAGPVAGRDLEAAADLADPFAPTRAPRAPAPPLALDTLPPVPPPPDTPFSLIEAAAGEALDAGVEEAVVVDPDQPDEAAPAAEAAARALPRVPLFSDLGPEAFVALTGGVELRRFAPGEAALREGEPGTSFFVVASGRFAVSRRDEAGQPVVLAHLGEGDFFGEMALLSGAPRAATVAAEEPSEALEIPAAVLQALARRHPHVAGSLRRFYRQRLLANALAVSPIFRPFDRHERKAIVERFRTREVAAGEVLIREGTPSDGLYVVLDGAMDVTKRRGAREVLAGHLREGDLFGEVSCLRKSAATATVRARRAGSVLRLPRAEFDELVMRYPQILELVSTLTDERLEALEAIVSGHARYTEDGLVLT